MIDTLEKVTLQDLGLAKSLGVDLKKVEELSLYQMKNEMHTKAFQMRDRNQTISQEEADTLNARLEEIILHLEKYGYDPMYDYIVDFNSFVIDNENYNSFCW